MNNESLFWLSSRFVMFSAEHYMPFVIAFFILSISCYVSYKKSIKFKQNVGLVLSVASLLSTILYAYHNYHYSCNGDYDLFLMKGLPLWVCNFISYFAVLAFLTLDKKSFAYTFFMGLTGNLIASITPELYVGYPDPEYIIFFLMHALNLIIPVYMAFAFNYIPSKKDLIIYVLMATLIFAGSHSINLILGSNYNYTISKPTTLSMLDNVGAWPYYLIFIEIAGILLALVVYGLMNFITMNGSVIVDSE